MNVSNEQNSELIKLIQEIENSEEGIKKLESVVQDANNENQGQGDILKEVWLKDTVKKLFSEIKGKMVSILQKYVEFSDLKLSAIDCVKILK